MQQYKSFAEFYLYYLSEHKNATCRRLHFVGSCLVLFCLAFSLWHSEPWWLLSMPLVGYRFAWGGHFFFEHNKPATFQYPWYSLLGDWKMFAQILSRKIRF